MTQTPLTARRWSRVEYERLVELGVFDGDPVELIGGELMVAEPQGVYHATVLGAIHDALRAAIPRGWIVRAQMPVSLDYDSAPEPDLAVVRGTRADDRGVHPMIPALAIEVSDASLAFDRTRKGSLYARAGVPEYWIANAVERLLEIYRDPTPDVAAPYGYRYRSMERRRSPAEAAARSVPMEAVPIGDLFP
jgi:Uma2 family endonuclease